MPSQQKQIIKQEGNPNDTKTFALRGRAPTRAKFGSKDAFGPVPVEGGAIGARSCVINWARIAFEIRRQRILAKRGVV